MSIRAQILLERDGFRLAVDLHLPGRGITVIRGPSGCGKTTLLRVVAGLEPEARGRLEVDGESWQGPGHRLPPHERAVGYVFQEARLFPHLNVRRNIGYGHARRRRSLSLPLEEIITLLDIGPLLDRFPKGLSGGEQQRVALARALAAGPRLLLLDEPLAALDRKRQDDLLSCLEEVCRRLALPMLYVTHSRREMIRLADHLVLMRAGKVTAQGPVSEVLASPVPGFADEDGPYSLIRARVAGYDARFSLSRLEFEGGRLFLPGRVGNPGHELRLLVLARDISLSLTPARDSSILNIVPVRILDMVEEDSALVMVRLRAGRTPLLARITRRSAAMLGLAPGRSLYAQVKSVSLFS